MQIITKYLALCLTLVLLFGSACGTEQNDGENFGNILDSPDGLILVEEEHRFGWGRPDCFMCHNLNNIHVVDRTGTGIDVEAIQEATFENGTEAFCQTCHGTNGTTAAAAALTH